MSEADALADRVTTLTDEVVGLREDAAGIRAQLATARGRILWVALIAVVALGLAAGVAITAFRGAATDRRVDAICPVLALVVGGFDPSSRPAGSAREAYIANLTVMHQAYVDLGCTTPLVPPRTSP